MNIAYKQFPEYPFFEYLEFVSHSNSKTGPVCSNTKILTVLTTLTLRNVDKQ